LKNVKLHKFYSSPNIIKIIKPRRKRWTVHVVCMGKPEVRDY
jgi:hypothetical protein